MCYLQIKDEGEEEGEEEEEEDAEEATPEVRAPPPPQGKSCDYWNDWCSVN